MVAGNQDRARDVQLRFDSLADAIAWSPTTQVTVRDLWQEGAPFTCTLLELVRRDFVVASDGVPGGGLLVLQVTKGAA